LTFTISEYGEKWPEFVLMLVAPAVIAVALQQGLLVDLNED